MVLVVDVLPGMVVVLYGINQLGDSNVVNRSWRHTVVTPGLTNKRHAARTTSQANGFRSGSPLMLQVGAAAPRLTGAALVTVVVVVAVCVGGVTVAVVSCKGPVLVAVAVCRPIGTKEEQKEDAFKATSTALHCCMASRCSIWWTTSTSGSL